MKDSIRQSLSAGLIKDLTIWSEIIVAPVIALAFAFWFEQGLLHGHGLYPWLWLVPLLLGLRYGLSASVVSSILLAAGSTAGSHFHLVQPGMPLLEMVGGAFAALAVGQYRSLWQARIDSSETQSEYAQTQLESLSRAFFLTRLSHDRLEEALITQPLTLRKALETLQLMSAQSHDGFTAEAVQNFLQLLAHYCRFETMAIHRFADDKFVPDPFAAIGPRRVLATDDILIRQTAETGKTCYFSVDQMRQSTQISKYRAVFPIMTSGNRQLGILTVGDMPLLALNEENLTAATAMIQYFADGIETAQYSYAMCELVPHCPPEFSRELIRLRNLYLKARIRSMLIAIEVSPRLKPRLQILIEQKRGLDVYWIDPFTEPQRSAGLIVLLPLAGPATARGYIERAQKILTPPQPDRDINDPASIHIISVPMDEKAPVSLLQECGVNP